MEIMTFLLNENHRKFYKEFNKQKITIKENVVKVGNETIMTLNQKDIMAEYVKIIAPNINSRILEVGYGAGVFCEELHKYNIQEHVIVDCHPEICLNALKSKKRERNITIINDLWQNVFSKIGKFNGIFYDVTCPTGEGFNDLFKFIDIAFQYLLKEQGVLTFWYCSNSIDEQIYNKLQNHSSKLEIKMFEKPQNEEWIFKTRRFIIFKAVK